MSLLIKRKLSPLRRYSKKYSAKRKATVATRVKVVWERNLGEYEPLT